jgi:competence protein ComEC
VRRAWRVAVAQAANRARHTALAAFVVGLIAGPRAGPVAIALAAALVLAALAAYRHAEGSPLGRADGACDEAAQDLARLELAVRRRDRRRGALVLVVAAGALMGGVVVADLRLSALDRTALRPWLGHAADVRAIVLEAPRRRAFGRVAAIVRVRVGPGRGERVLVLGKRLPAVIGEVVRVRGGFRALPPFEAAARRRGAHALVVADEVVATGARRGGVQGALDRVRVRADRALSAGLPPPLGALARGMVLGEDAALPDDLAADFRAAGLTHLVAASGANVALLAALVLAACAVAGVPLRARLGLAVAAIAGYVPLAGGGPSIQRAGVMGVATIVAAIASRAASRWYAMLLAAAVTLALNPRAAEDPGWELSFVAVVALLLVAPPLRARLARRLPAGVADAAAVTLAASLGTAPLIAVHFERVSLVSLPANLLAAPAVAPIMWLGAAAALLGQATPALAVPVMALAAWPLALLVLLGHAAASVPGAQASVALSPLVAVALYAVLGVAAVPAARRVVRRAVRKALWPGGRRRAEERGGGEGHPGARGGGEDARRRPICATFAAPVRACGLAAAIVAIAAITLVHRAPAPPAGLVVSALDVGQGDATLIQHGPFAMLVDAGPAAGPIVTRLRDAGVERLDLLVITHAQSDHEGGAAAVLDRVPVGLVLDGRDGVHTPDGNRLAAAALRHHVRLAPPAAGEVLRAGPLELDVLSPRPEQAALHAGDDPNRRAIVAELRDGAFSMLLTADTESDVLDTLPVGPVDVLKVAHHGSADEGLPALLTRLRPSAAIIEVGRHNPYGHPAASTLQALRTVPEVLRTDRDGTIRLRIGASGPRAIAVERHA